MKQSDPIRILLVEDHAIVREGLRAIIESHPDLTIVNEASDGREALLLAKSCSPNVIVMDINMAGLNGIETTRRMIEQHPGAKIVGLSVHVQSHFVSEMIQAGAVGYVPKKSAAQELITAIRTVIEGKMYISPDKYAIREGLTSLEE